MSTPLNVAEDLIVQLVLRVVSKALDDEDGRPLERARFEAKIEAQKLLLEHEGDLILAAKHAAQQKLGGG